MSAVATRREAPDQPSVQRLLGDMHAASGGRLDQTLEALQRLSIEWGYFDHLVEKNEYLAFPSPDDVEPLRLQINYSRLAYRAPTGVGGPACPLCFENIGIAGKERLRVFEFELDGTPFFAHLTPFPLHPGHFVANLRQHAPMSISTAGLRQSMEFLRRAPGWLIASNSDVEWAGASVLGHHHVQVFADLRLPVEAARAVQAWMTPGGCRASLLRWYCPVVRLSGNANDVLAAADRMIARWKGAEPGARTFNYLMRGDGCEDVVLHLFYRHPAHRTPEHRREIKAEGVGIIEMAGEVIVPPINGMTREENRAFFEREGIDIIRDIVRGNGPWPVFDAFRGQLAE